MIKILYSLKISKYTVALIVILLIGAFFRFFQISSIPPSPSVDEVALGYNAYSILHTGKGVYGKFFALVLRAYDDYRPALYVYLIIPFIMLFNLTLLAFRMI